MHHTGPVHADAKRDALASVRAVLAQDWTAVDLIARHTPCPACRTEAIAYLAVFFAIDEDDLEPCEHGSIVIRPGALEELDHELAEMQTDLADG